MSPAEAIASLPDDTRVSVTIGGDGVTIGELRAALVSGGPVMLTTEQAAERFGFAPGYWREVARRSARAVKGRQWLLPADECQAHMDARARARSTPTAWEETEAPQASRAGPRGLHKR